MRWQREARVAPGFGEWGTAESAGEARHDHHYGLVRVRAREGERALRMGADGVERRSIAMREQRRMIEAQVQQA